MYSCIKHKTIEILVSETGDHDFPTILKLVFIRKRKIELK